MASERTTVLIVEDSMSLGAVYRAYLRDEPFDVAHVPDGASAMARIKRDPPQASILLEERFPGSNTSEEPAPPGFPDPQESLGITTFFTELVKRPELRQKLWPDEPADSFRQRFRRRTQRAELLSAMARLGVSYIDLYLLAISGRSSFALGRQREDQGESSLATQFVDLLESQSRNGKGHAYAELSGAAENFDLILAVNFPQIPESPLPAAAGIYGATLQRQVPVGRMSGSVNKRLVRQFRMPGFPYVLVTTDVLQEGEDLHTFCQRVIHYGIAWTASAMEQRTGRVDRIGSLVQRHLDGTEDPPSPEQFIQVYCIIRWISIVVHNFLGQFGIVITPV